jgi:anaerobic dimethyl sulfoxide reductase subunit B
MQKGFYFDQTRCTGCQACAVACKDWHDTPEGPSRWVRVITIEKGKFPHPSVFFLFSPCYHCAEPACVSACPHHAIEKREEDGIVVLKEDSCVGREACGVCLEACLYGAPQFQAEPGRPMEKCDLCRERWVEGKKPICVESCPARALDAGFLENLEEEYGATREAEGFAYLPHLKPSILFRRKKP